MMDGQAIVQTIRIQALGDLQVARVAGPFIHAVRLPARKMRQVLMSLVAAGCRGLAVHVLSAALWPDAEGDAAYRALVTAVYRLRRLLHCHEAISFAGGRVALDAAHCWVDAWHFEQQLRLRTTVVGGVSGGSIRATLALYRGPLCADEEMALLFEARERLRQVFVRAVLAAGLRQLTAADELAAIELLEHAVEVESDCEELYRALMVMLAGTGDRSGAQRAFERCRRMMLQRYGCAPSAATERAWREHCCPASVGRDPLPALAPVAAVR
jgi:LuxR family transcriptional regulator, maltose regulon positive regulatory protein